MCPLAPGEDHLCRERQSERSRRQAHLDLLVTNQAQTGTSMLSAAPISPEERLTANHERMQKHTHLARLCRSVAVPLTLIA